MLLSELLTTARVKVPLGGRTKGEILRELVEMAAADNEGADVEAILSAVREREEVLSTGIGGGIAIPHGKSPHVHSLTLVAGVAREAVDFDALDGKPVNLFFLLIGPESAAGAHVKALSRISRLMRREDLRARLATAASPDAFLAVIRTSEAA